MKTIGLLMAFLAVMSAIPLSFAEETDCTWTAKQECIPTRPRLDVVFVIDSTGSMADEIRTVKTHLTKIVKEVEQGQPTPILRVGVVSYRDHKPEEYGYLYRKLDLTTDINQAMDFVWGIEAAGGGDLPEAVADGLDEAINQMDWGYTDQNQQVNSKSRKLIFLIGDAAPHGVGSTDNSFKQGCPDGHSYKQNIEDAKQKGIKIFMISGSGIDSIGIQVYKDIAYMTGGSYTHLNYARQDVDQYYRDEGFAQDVAREYVAVAKTDADYEESTNSILTNTLGALAKSSMQAEAMDMGIEYDEEPTSDPSGDSLNIFLRRVFDKVAFWRE